jgi:pseudouridine-5'-phosphate glycosidase/pseudouridine kinase
LTGTSGVAFIAHITDKEGAMNWVLEGSQPKKQQIVSRASDGSVLLIRYFPANPLVEGDIYNVTGAGECKSLCWSINANVFSGDTLAGAFLASLVNNEAVISQPSQLEAAIHLAQKCAVLTIRSELAVSPAISSVR